jgi:hypothetical protein
MRKYSEAWQTLRDAKRLEIVAPRGWHNRIYSGIRKERYKDDAHALFLAETKQFDRVYYKRKGDTMIFLLERKPVLRSLDNKDLFEGE